MHKRTACFLIPLSICFITTSGAAPPTPAVTTPPSASIADANDAAAKPPRVVMLRLGDAELTVEDYVHYLQKNPELLRPSKTPEGKAQIVKELVTDRLLQDDVIRKGLVPKEKQQDEQALLKAFRELAKVHFPPPPHPSDEEARAFYQAHRQDYGIPAMWRISQIQFRIPAKASDEKKAEARAKAEKALERLKAGEPFDKVAGEMTENTAARDHHGDLGFMAPGALAWMKEQRETMQLGRPTGVLESPKGLEILMKTDERPERISPFEQVKERVSARVVQVGQERLKEAYVAQLEKLTPVILVQDDLKALFPKGMFPPAVPAAPAPQLPQPAVGGEATPKQ